MAKILNYFFRHQPHFRRKQRRHWQGWLRIQRSCRHVVADSKYQPVYTGEQCKKGRLSFHIFYTVSQKKTLNSCLKLPQIVTDFQNSFAVRLIGKFATNSYLNIPPNLKYIATLPCEIWMSQNWQQCEICIVINDKWQGSIAKHLSCNATLHYKYNIASVYFIWQT